MIRVVVADGQALIVGAVAALLSREDDMSVTGQFGNGRDCLEFIRRHRPDVLLSEIEMPGLSGLEVAECVAAEGLPTRIVIVTTFGRGGYLRRAMTAGVRGYVLKDSPAEQLPAAIRQVAAGRRAIGPELAEAAWDCPQDPLTARQRDALRYAAEGLSNKEISKRLRLSPGTVRNYLCEAASRLGARNRIDAARMAAENGWL